MNGRKAAATAIRDQARQQAKRAQNVHQAIVVSTNPLKFELLYAGGPVLTPDDYELSQWFRFYEGEYGVTVDEVAVLTREDGSWVVLDIVADKTIKTISEAISSGLEVEESARTAAIDAAIDALSSDDLGLPWRHDVGVFTPAALETGTWGFLPSASAINNGVKFNTSTAQNDETGWDLILAAGTWRLDGLFLKNNNYAIATVLLDGVSVGTFDGYAASSSYNNVVAITGITVALSGKHRISLKAATRNASNTTGWYIALSALSMRRTA